MIFGLFGKREDRLAPVNAVFARVAEASRQPWLYLDGGIPDSFDGRFESLTLHAFLLLRRLRQLPEPATAFAQDFTDATFAYLELGFRNGGVSDIAVPKRMKKIAESFFGRVQAYEEALQSGDQAALVEALRRNASPGEAAQRLSDYILRSQAHLATLDFEAVLAQSRLFPDMDALQGGARA
ncbi:MAG: ubiquinol-cytochrome C chaperone family protein [Bosea sp. (in: a-proteobacteria)]